MNINKAQTVPLYKLALAGGLLIAAFLLRIYQLHIPSYTWDEVTDREIAWSYILNGDLTHADREFSQARLPIYLEALVIKYWGDSEAKLRAIGVTAGLISLFVIWRLGNKVFGSPTGLIAMALSSFNPYHLMISRLSGTHSGAVSALFYTLALWFMIEFWSIWRKHPPSPLSSKEKLWLLLFGTVAGIATGAKLTGILLNINLILVLITSGNAWKKNFGWILLTGMLWLVFFLLASPIYLSPHNIIAAWEDQAMHWEQIRGYQFLGNVYETLPIWYWATVVPIKFTIPVALAVLFQVIWLCSHWRKITAAQRLTIINLFPLLILSFRNWQSPTYTAILIGPFFILAGQTLVQLGQRFVDAYTQRKPLWKKLLIALSFLWLIMENARVLIITHPDYLMTGYDFGDKVIGQFWGPAVYHCQGIGRALAYLSTQQDGPILAPKACTGPIAYYSNIHNLSKITFKSKLKTPEAILNYRYVLLPYTVTYMFTPYPLLQNTEILRQGLNRYCTPIYTYRLQAKELFWVYDCQAEMKD